VDIKRHSEVDNLLSTYFSDDMSLQDLVDKVYVLGLEHGSLVWKGLSPEKEKQLEKWRSEQDVKFAAKQGKKRAYYGAIGGAYVYSYCHTSLGTSISVKNEATGETLDLTDYGDW